MNTRMNGGAKGKGHPFGSNVCHTGMPPSNRTPAKTIPRISAFCFHAMLNHLALFTRKDWHCHIGVAEPTTEMSRSPRGILS